MSKWRALAVSVWNGPFYIGKLERPVSTGEAILKIMETAWRGVLMAGLGWSAIMIVVGVLAFISEITYESQEDDMALEAAVDEALAEDAPVDADWSDAPLEE